MIVRPGSCEGKPMTERQRESAEGQAESFPAPDAREQNNTITRAADLGPTACLMLSKARRADKLSKL